MGEPTPKREPVSTAQARREAWLRGDAEHIREKTCCASCGAEWVPIHEGQPERGSSMKHKRGCEYIKALENQEFEQGRFDEASEVDHEEFTS